jgi:hypothetical protein
MKAKGRCYNCLACDHFTFSCRDPPRCWFCGQSGHTSSLCPEKKHSAPSKLNLYSLDSFPPLPSTWTHTHSAVDRSTLHTPFPMPTNLCFSLRLPPPPSTRSPPAPWSTYSLWGAHPMSPAIGLMELIVTTREKIKAITVPLRWSPPPELHQLSYVVICWRHSGVHQPDCTWFAGHWIHLDASGLTTNMTKTEFYPIQCHDLDMQQILGANQTTSSFPCTYLGLPLHYKRLSKAAISPLVHKIGNRLPGCKRNFLTYPGRELLVKTVLSSMPTLLDCLQAPQVGWKRYWLFSLKFPLEGQRTRQGERRALSSKMENLHLAEEMGWPQDKRSWKVWQSTPT